MCLVEAARLMLKLNVVNCYHVLVERSNDWAAVAGGCGVLLVLLVLVLVVVVVWKKRRDNDGMAYQSEDVWPCTVLK